MKKTLLSLLTFVALMAQAQNPFFQEFGTYKEATPFSKIKNSHYEEAIDRGINLAQQEINAIVNQRSRPDFENTIVALENVGADLNRVLNVFYPLMSANSDNEMMEISLRVSAKLSEYSTNISLNEGLWQKVKEVYENKNEDLVTKDTEENKTIEEAWNSEEFDRFRKVPGNIDSGYSKYIGMPYTEIPSPFTENESYASFMENRFLNELKAMDVEVECIYQSKEYILLYRLAHKPFLHNGND